MKESDAKKKVRPFMKTAHNEPNECYGSACVMWIVEITNRDHARYGDGDCGLKQQPRRA